MLPLAARVIIMTILKKLSGRADSTFRNGLHPGAGALTSRRGTDHGERPVPVTPATDEWVNEGGADVGPSHEEMPEETPSPLPGSSRRTARETPDWCRQRAAADLVAAGEMDTANGRLRFQYSAVSWTARADLLQRLEDSSKARRIASAKVWPEGDTPPAAHRTPREPKEPKHVWL